MELTHTTQNDIQIITLSGRFDAFEVPIFNTWLSDNKDVKHLVVNMSGVGFIDSSGLATLVKGMKHCRQNKGDLYICDMQQAVKIIFELTRLDKAFNIYTTQDEAIEAVSTD